MKKTQKQTGFTLVELLITLIIAGILVSIAAPSFSGFIKDNQITTTTNHLIAHLQYARSEAISKGLAVNVAKKSATAKDLSKGWTIYTDSNSSNGNTAYDSANDTLLKDFDGYGSANIAINTDTNGNNWIAFNNKGLLAEGSNSVQIAICDDRGVSSGRLITISPTGRARSEKSTSTTNPLTTCTPL